MEKIGFENLKIKFQKHNFIFSSSVLPQCVGHSMRKMTVLFLDVLRVPGDVAKPFSESMCYHAVAQSSRELGGQAFGCNNKKIVKK